MDIRKRAPHVLSKYYFSVYLRNSCSHIVHRNLGITKSNNERYQSNYVVGKSDRTLLALDVQKTSSHVDASMEIGATITGFLSK